MEFLATTDFKGIISASIMSRLRGVNDENLQTSEELATSELDPLRENYDIEGELAKVGDGRNDMLVRMVTNITAYYLFNTVEDLDIPERIIDNFLRELENIKAIATGKLSTSLDPLYDEETGLAKSNYRFGGDAPRDQEIF